VDFVGDLQSRVGAVLTAAAAELAFEAIMRTPYTQLYIHMIWATWDRLPLIKPEIESQIYAAIAAKCRQFKCEPVAIGGIENHVHLLTGFHTTTAIATLAKEIKGASSHLVTHKLIPGEFFKWQGAYGAFTIRHSDIPQIKAYIRNQKKHHADGMLDEELERIFIPSD
jgi:REP element-mobilizing transposase RayT